ncbi:hypothetical protein HK097_006113 [Rhizophlyctis rosea]|uniref:Prefoldin subunit 4 n=1 Tax=Rhizophlyctis rosea TaxID=64517 RepID=A0AAD5X2X6_9FUNG|nr:hypothetical protein HK097_006113 [Rhizophlyctis rosea]
MTKMLREGEEADAEVTWEDQQNINAFSKLNGRLEALDEIYQEKKKEKEYLEDLTQELELADEDESVKYRIGDAYVSITLDEANERITAENSELSTELDGITSKMETINKEMAKLKAILYGKFGKSINLEK